MRTARTAFLAALTALAVAGCGAGRGDNPTGFVPVKGKVVGPDGRPLAWVNVGFDPAERGLVSGGAIAGADGTFTLKSGEKDGMTPGKYKVTVEPIRGKAGAPKLDARFGESASTPLTAEITGPTSDLVIEVK
jgi:hypothetical protein